jgi:predicted dehydrogenase
MKDDKKKLRLGIIGLGAMGHPHVGFALKTPEVELSALCDSDPAMLERARQTHFNPPSACPPVFGDALAMLDSGLVDGILISTPHYDHEPIAIAAFERGIHVLCEKPLTVTVQGARNMLAAWEKARAKKPGLVFAEMFMQRTWTHWKKIKSLIDDGELGTIVRATWIVTDWFRTANYYKSGGWRATWNGEGGGVLTNQSPHNLDLLQWFLGMPASLSAFGGLGKHHHIAVEDESSAVLQYANGAVAHFITSTGESPGTNRLEIVGENGKLVYENNELVFHRNRSSMRVWSDTTNQSYQGPECWTIKLPLVPLDESGHRLVIQNFARHILSGESLVAPASEGINQVILTNAMMISLLSGGANVAIERASEFQALLAQLQQKELKK